LRSLDEAPEWGADLLDALRTPLEEGDEKSSTPDNQGTCSSCCLSGCARMSGRKEVDCCVYRLGRPPRRARTCLLQLAHQNFTGRPCRPNVPSPCFTTGGASRGPEVSKTPHPATLPTDTAASTARIGRSPTLSMYSSGTYLPESSARFLARRRASSTGSVAASI
jgi:hypothetical protein